MYTGYDQNWGMRGTAAIPNSLGVTNFKIAYTIDTTTGCQNAPPSPSAWPDDVGISTTHSYDLTIADGNAICIWVRAQDFIEHTNEAAIIVHVDSSPPEIPFLWLQRDGEIDLAVHSTTQFSDMK